MFELDEIFVDGFWASAARIAGVYLCVIVIAAVISYLGNQLGRWIGKHKLSIWKMRPRHTSIVITTCTGAVIAVLTLTIFAAFSEPVRGLLGGVEKLRQEERELRATVETLRRTVAEGAFVWTVGEPIVHMTIPEGLPVERTRAAVTSLLAEANLRTVLRNNKIAAEKNETPLNASDILIESQSNNLEHIIEKVSQGTGVAGLRVVAQENSLYRKSALVRLEYLPVKLVYKQGDVVFRRELDSNSVVTGFYQFIEDMKASAIKKGMIPIDGSLGGGISQEDLQKLQDKMGAQAGKFFLVAKANRDLYDTNSLDVSLTVEPGSKPEPEQYQW